MHIFTHTHTHTHLLSWPKCYNIKGWVLRMCSCDQAQLAIMCWWGAMRSMSFSQHIIGEFWQRSNIRSSVYLQQEKKRQYDGRAPSIYCFFYFYYTSINECVVLSKNILCTFLITEKLTMSLIQQIINQLHLFPVWMSNIGHYLRMTKAESFIKIHCSKN